MDNSLKHSIGQRYRVKQLFTDYDGIVHEVGESWTYLGTNFLPYEDGLTLYTVSEQESKQVRYRLQWREEEQAAIIENFLDFVEAY